VTVNGKLHNLRRSSPGSGPGAFVLDDRGLADLPDLVEDLRQGSALVLEHRALDVGQQALPQALKLKIYDKGVVNSYLAASNSSLFRALCKMALPIK
jgi:hypothetical protein